MVDYLLFALIIFILIVDNPFNNIEAFRKIYNLLKYLLVFLGIIHLIELWEEFSVLDKGFVSGVLLIGLTFVYTLATEHTGIEDKVARKYFKITTWLLLWFTLLVHFYINYVILYLSW